MKADTNVLIAVAAKGVKESGKFSMSISPSEVHAWRKMEDLGASSNGDTVLWKTQLPELRDFDSSESWNDVAASMMADPLISSRSDNPFNAHRPRSALLWPRRSRGHGEFRCQCSLQ
jgi:hypothetical protein